jgi:predicted dehydrogenase
MPDPLDIALWGCGNMGTSLASALLATGEARLAVVHDLRPEASSAFAERYGAQIAPSSEALLGHPGLDGVIVALPPYLHAMAVCKAAKARIDVFCEKPMAPRVTGCREMLAAVKHTGIKLMIGHVLRYYEPYRSIQRWTADGRFGKLYSASIWRVVNGARWATIPDYWRANRAQSGGYLLEIGAHELDMLRCLMGRPETVYAAQQKVLPYSHEMEDHILVQVRFADGGSAVYEGGGGSSVSRYGFRFYFERATLMSESAFDASQLQIYDRQGNALEALREEFTSEHPVQAELQDWLAALRDDIPIAIPGEEGLATVALAQAAYTASESGQIVRYSTQGERS